MTNSPILCLISLTFEWREHAVGLGLVLVVVVQGGEVLRHESVGDLLGLGVHLAGHGHVGELHALEGGEAHGDPQLEVDGALAGVVLEDLVLVEVEVVVDHVEGVLADHADDGVGTVLDELGDFLLDFKVLESGLGLEGNAIGLLNGVVK
jgi:hypothetical protein